MAPGESISSLRVALDRRERSALEVTEQALASIEESELRLNAYVYLCAESAVDQAKAADKRLRRGDGITAWTGVPVAVKDNIHVAGAPTRGGSAALPSCPSQVNADLVARIIRLGAVIVGKTNMNELGWGLDPRIGRVNNPVDPRRTAGGSSGGSAATVGSGAVPVAIGTDAGGSVRMPAAFCQVAGLKPTHGLLPRGGTLPGSWSLSDLGLITRTAEDMHLLLDGLGGRPEELNEPVRRRVAVPANWPSACHSSIRDAFSCALTCLAESNWDITECEIEVAGSHDAWMTIFAAENAEALCPFLGDRVQLVSQDVRHLIEVGRGIPRDQVYAAWDKRLAVSAAVERHLAEVDAIVTPTVPSPPAIEDPREEDDSYYGDMRWTVPANLSCHPAITIPLLGSSLPAGMQLIASAGQDRYLRALAAEAEAIIATIEPARS